MPITTASKAPAKSISCLALVKTGSTLHHQWKLSKPSYCIYEYDKAFDSHQIRWTDGSWQELSEDELNDVVLLEQFDESTWGQILGD